MAQDLEAAPRVRRGERSATGSRGGERRAQPARRRPRSAPDLLPVVLAGDAHLGRAGRGACSRFCPASSRPSRRTRSASSRRSRSSRRSASDGLRAFEAVANARASRPARGGRREARRHRVHGTGVRGRVSRRAGRGAADRRRADGQPVPRLGRRGAVHRRVRRVGRRRLLLVRTSNPGGADIQELPFRAAGGCGSRSPGSRASVARTSAAGLSSVGAVIGATHPQAVARARELMPQALLLLPGSARRARGGRRGPRLREPSGGRAVPRRAPSS